MLKRAAGSTQFNQGLMAIWGNSLSKSNTIVISHVLSFQPSPKSHPDYLGVSRSLGIESYLLPIDWLRSHVYITSPISVCAHLFLISPYSKLLQWLELFVHMHKHKHTHTQVHVYTTSAEAVFFPVPYHSIFNPCPL